ncbi:MAG: hypothetical protein A3D52_01925 [Candidatus Taylorbacteria bacterium RIFCSPHIGHO2_02_FULL_44_36]|uniref:Uncharacterized protein n=1 Tax=Candidatus Taylorbacteria bacterium RIFCSPLOWO2_12_FULL_44_15c TaxID=1802333 RepID=A0A1G2P4Q7_9BACT|nr:MAG: hypothetical protein A3D52_01925 [Candidatus Taylorbacteria bacterium RIFCSPHIGHO2_02_FULL_44_36]OHA37929.1 MAG: hypothetical protein A3I97_02700 [Candidatus Taylorbacteria bacterium RIFCSPLOWO2_02_FULL_44_35]OHA43347.1 MAG: hypothetical protein A3G03_03210 [Candidatus Taylorbacteria bacterium RIFCSPLOWO2_12_FULL_44_15c]
MSKADENVSGEAYDVKYESDLSTQDFVKISKNGSIYFVSVIPKTNMYSLPVGIHTVTIKEVKVVGISSGKYYYVSGIPITFTFEIKDIPQAEIIPIKTSHIYTTITNGSVNNIGTIGSFKIKLNSNSGVSIVSCRVRVESSDFFKGYIGKVEEIPGFECENSDLANLLESSTDNNGVSNTIYYFFVGWVGTHDWSKYMNLPESTVKFHIEDFKVKDQRTGIIRTVQNSLVFEMNIVKP